MTIVTSVIAVAKLSVFLSAMFIICYLDIETVFLFRKAIEPSVSTNIPSSANDPPLESSSDEKEPTAISASNDNQSGDGKDPGVDLNEENATEPKTKDSVPRDEVEEEKWSQDRMMSLSRKFNLDLAPKVC